MANLETAIRVALEAHSAQIDKAGQPYILHPLRVMLQCGTEQEMIVAVLHDVVEDSEVTIARLKKYGFSTAVLDAVDCLTKKDKESYQIFIERVATNNLATKVKIIDIKDNLNLSRLDNISDKDIERVKKYNKALNYLFEKHI